MADRARWRRWLRRLGWAAALLVLAVPVLLLAVLHLVDFRRSEAAVAAAFAAVDLEPERQRVATARGPVFAIAAGARGRPVVLGIHGTPGGWDNLLDVFVDPGIAARYRVIGYDRPGFGASDAPVAVDLPGDAAAAARVLERLAAGERAIVVGHSYGAPVAVHLAAERPDLVAGLVLVGAAVDPALERITWYQRLALLPGLRQLLPAALRNSTDELLPLRGELEALALHWPDLAVPVAAVHGGRDGLVPVANVDFLRTTLGDRLVAAIVDPDEGHFIPWQRPELVVRGIEAVRDARR